jgi:hypothetical protein
LIAKGTPVEATRALQELPQRPQRLFHAMSYGSYLIWAAPEQKVFIDPRIELYPFEQWRDYILLGQGVEVEALLAKYRIDGMMLSIEEQAPLLEYAPHPRRRVARSVRRRGDGGAGAIRGINVTCCALLVLE